MYVCGPTVYNYIHIGNARPAINYDVVRRYFEYKGYEVIYVSNFTDVDDKLINRSKELNESVPEIAEKYIKAFYEDVGALNVKKATSNPRVMNHMQEIIDFIKELVDEGYAYESDGDVYFRTRQFGGYGKLSHQSLDDLKVGARIEAGEQKKMHSILLYGKKRNLAKSVGIVHLVKVVQAGISNAQLWLIMN